MILPKKQIAKALISLREYSSVVLIVTVVLVTSVFCSNWAEIDRT